MLNIKTTLHHIILMVAMILMLGMAACTPETVVEEPPSIEPDIITNVPEITEATDTPPSPEVSPSVLLVSSAEADPFTWSQTQKTMESLAADSNLNLVLLDSLTSEMVTPEVQIVVGVGPNLDLNGLAINYPDVFFVAIDNPTAAVANNVNIIGDMMLEMRQQAFLAGYLSALISSDYKITALISADRDAADLLAESYTVGARFFCGLCQPLYPPYNAFPQYETLAVNTTEEGFRTVVDYYNTIGVEVIYVHGDLAGADLLDYLAELEIKVVSDRTPDFLRNNWVGTIAIDPGPALEDLWPDLLAGAAGVQLPGAITLIDTDLGLVSAGRFRVFEDMLASLQAGLVSIERAP